MPNQESIDHQTKLLAIHRRNARHYQNQIRLLGQLTPQGITGGIVEERQAIARIRGILREWGINDLGSPEDTRNEYEKNLGVEL